MSAFAYVRSAHTPRLPGVGRTLLHSAVRPKFGDSRRILTNAWTRTRHASPLLRLTCACFRAPPELRNTSDVCRSVAADIDDRRLTLPPTVSSHACTDPASRREPPRKQLQVALPTLRGLLGSMQM